MSSPKKHLDDGPEVEESPALERTSRKRPRSESQSDSQSPEPSRFRRSETPCPEERPKALFAKQRAPPSAVYGERPEHPITLIDSSSSPDRDSEEVNYNQDSECSDTDVENIMPMEINTLPKNSFLGGFEISGREKKKITEGKRIQELEAEVVELQKFIIDQGLATKAPPLIRCQLERYEGERIAASIKWRMTDTYEATKQSLRKDNLKINPDSASLNMFQFVPEIREVALMHDGLEMAFDLLMHLAEHFLPYYHWKEDSKRFSYLASYLQEDRAADRLLVEVSKAIKKKNPKFNPCQSLNTLVDSRNEMRLYRLPFFSRSIKLFKEYDGDYDG